MKTVKNNDKDIIENSKNKELVNSTTESYFENVSKNYKLAKIISIAVLMIFLFSSFVIYGEKLTYENARYVLRDIGQILSEDNSDPASIIHYEADGNMDHAIYGSSIVIAGESTVTMFGVSGKEKLTDHTSFSSPTIKTSDKYCVVYSLGGYNLSVYNTVARVYDMKFDFPIYDVDVSDNGYIAVLTQSVEYRSVVYLYDSDFKLVTTYNKVKYPCSVSLSSDASYVYISVFGAQTGDILTQLSVYKLSQSTPLYTKDVYGGLPFDSVCFDNDIVSLICENSLTFIGLDGLTVNTHSYSQPIKKFNTINHNITVVTSGRTSKIYTYNPNGNVISQYESADVIDAFYFDNVLIARTKDGLFDTQTQSIIKNDQSTSPLNILYHNGRIIYCYSNFLQSLAIAK